MNAKVEKLENNKVKLEITVSADKFEEGMQKAFFKNAKYFNVPGFRKGKATRQVVERYYGKGILYEDAFNIVASEAYDEAIKANNVEVVDNPEIDVAQMDSGKDLIFTATVTVKPEVKLGKYKGIKVEKKEYKVTAKEVNAEIDAMADKNARIVAGDENSVVEKGYTAVIDFEGFKDGAAFDGGKGENYPLEIGSGAFIPGFEDQLIGLKAGDETDVNVTFPENYFSEELAGQPVVFKVKVNEIKVKELPKIDDEFAKDVSEFDTLAELKADTKKKLEEENAKKAKFEMEDEAVKAIVADTEIDIPVVMIDHEVDDYIRELESRIAYQGMELKTYLQLMGKDIADLKAEYAERAKENVKTKLVLESIFKAENIEITDKDIEDKLTKFAESYGATGANVSELVKNPTDQLKEYAKEELKYDLAVKFVMDNAK